MLTIRSNLASTYARTDYNRSADRLTNSFEKLATGVRITRASDDSAGLSVGTNLKAQMASLQQVARNAADGVSLLQTMDGAIGTAQERLARLRELTMQAVSDGVNTEQLGYLHQESDRVLEELGRIGNVTEYVGRKPLDGSTPTFTIQVGTRGDAEDHIDLQGYDIGLSALGLNGFQPTDRADLTTLDQVIDRLNEIRSEIGANQNRLQSAQETISANMMSFTATYARVMDADVAAETAAVSSNQVLMQAGASVISNTYEFSKMALRILEK